MSLYEIDESRLVTTGDYYFPVDLISDYWLVRVLATMDVAMVFRQGLSNSSCVVVIVADGFRDFANFIPPAVAMQVLLDRVFGG